MKIRLELELEQVNLILSILQNEPYAKVYNIINSIKKQGDEQFAEVLNKDELLTEKEVLSYDNET